MTRSRSRRGKGRLPAETTAFIDRETDAAEVKRRLSTARLVTLTGVGGAGKTRLAVHVADELHGLVGEGAAGVEVAAAGALGGGARRRSHDGVRGIGAA